jgi:hypothetical protein
LVAKRPPGKTRCASKDALRPRLALQLEAELAIELHRRGEFLDDDADVVHPMNRHAAMRSLGVRVWRVSA